VTLPLSFEGLSGEGSHPSSPSEIGEFAHGGARAMQESHISTGLAQVHSFPYAMEIRRLIEKDHVAAARRLLQVALSQSSLDPKISYWQMILAPPVVRKSDVRDIDRDLDYRWIDEKSKAYSGQWVALFSGELLAHGENLKELMAELKTSPPAGRPLVLKID